MTAHFRLTNLKEKKEKEKAKLHYMPCVIEKNGEAKVSEYFEPIIRERSKDDEGEEFYVRSL